MNYKLTSSYTDGTCGAWPDDDFEFREYIRMILPQYEYCRKRMNKKKKIYWRFLVYDVVTMVSEFILTVSHSEYFSFVPLKWMATQFSTNILVFQRFNIVVVVVDDFRPYVSLVFCIHARTHTYALAQSLSRAWFSSDARTICSV